VNDGLIDAFRHNTWATRELLAVCQNLSETQLHATAPGTYGSIVATLWHTVQSDASYCRRLTGEEPEWDWRTEELPKLDEIAEYIDDLAARWERFLATPFDAERTFVIKWHDEIDRDVPAGVLLVQALHHGNEHRAHICTVLTSIGVATPDLGAWDYAEATNRAPRRGT
jgi:uncharacterized damage-inducible protein DinB